MGHSSAIGLGIALAKPSRQVFVLDGDGALQMHMGTMVTIGSRQPKNLKHVVINNGCHESVGGQASEMAAIDVPGLAKACNYKHVFTATNETEMLVAIEKLRDCEGPALLEARVTPGARSDLGRPKASPVQNKEAFMDFLGA
jgi:phosphonopyruvate decarboxylase